ncbi:hypothetical protein McPS_32420 [Marichromatium sp. PS1]|uniref:AAA family ATPase n=1 Tax=Marichromatium sp. PS1 TaxID=3138932 RepID=UPI0032E54563
MSFLPVRDDLVVDLAASGNNPAARHRFEPEQLKAINAALSAGRPLLVRGEPGIGKSQLARAAAKVLKRAFVQHVVDARTESHDLLWHFDAVGRLAAAQVEGVLQSRHKSCAKRYGSDPKKHLAVRHFLYPRALWWAFDHQDAASQAPDAAAEQPPQLDGGDWESGCVVLIDEIDKAESDVPNGLLEALGAQRFVPPGRSQPVLAKGPPLLVIITTNEERVLPDAFIRRCLVLHLTLPREREALIARLMERGCTHFRNAETGDLDVAPEVLEVAANLLADDRAEAERRQWRPLPGQAEYLDLVRAVVVQSDGDLSRQLELIDQVAAFVLKKHPDAAREALDSTG